LGEAVVRKTLLLLMRVGERIGEVMGMGEMRGDSGTLYTGQREEI
jgi:hypothetical protein